MDSSSTHLRRIHVKTAAKEGQQWGGQHQYPKDAAQLMRDFPRLSADTHASLPIVALEWSVVFEQLTTALGEEYIWLHVLAKAHMPLTCQRCLDAVVTPIEVDHWFRFEKDEQTAAAQDEISEEDVLAMDEDVDVLALIEDELLMALPMIPMHETCVPPYVIQAQHLPQNQPDPAIATATSLEGDKTHPFAVLSRLRTQSD